MGHKKPKIRIKLEEVWNQSQEIEVANLVPKVASEPLPTEPGEAAPYSDEVAEWANNWSAKWIAYYDEHLANKETWGHSFHVPTEAHAHAFMELVPHEKRAYLMITWGNWDGTPLQPEWDNSSPTGQSIPIKEKEYPPGMAVAHSTGQAIQMLQAVEMGMTENVVGQIIEPPKQKKKKGWWQHFFGSK